MRGASLIVALAGIALSGACRQAPGVDALRDASAARGCAATADCGRDEYCAFTPGLCGRGKRPGACRAKATGCSNAYTPVCGCDGVVYDRECDAYAAGVDLSVSGGCHQGPRDWATCGARYCDVRTSYCEIVLSDVLDPPTDYACKPLPPSCKGDGGAPPTCACFPRGTRCESFCGPIETGGATGFHLTCRL